MDASSLSGLTFLFQYRIERRIQYETKSSLCCNSKRNQVYAGNILKGAYCTQYLDCTDTIWNQIKLAGKGRSKWDVPNVISTRRGCLTLGGITNFVLSSVHTYMVWQEAKGSVDLLRLRKAADKVIQITHAWSFDKSNFKAELKRMQQPYIRNIGHLDI
jgi:hypothetical protein